MNRYDLEGRCVFITGGGSGLGRATALMAAAGGARIVAADSVGPAAEETAALVAAEGGAARAVALDVRDGAAVRAAVAGVLETEGRLDGAFNAAGISGGIGATLDEAAWREVIDVNLTGLFLCQQAEIEAMRPAGRGSVVNAASVAGLVGTYVNLAYSASKHGVVGLTRSAALAEAKTGVRVNCVCPGWTDTPMTRPKIDSPEGDADVLARYPIGRRARPEEVAHLVCWLLSDAASYVTGAACPVDGGITAG